MSRKKKLSLEETYYLQDIIWDWERHARGNEKDYERAKRKMEENK